MKYVLDASVALKWVLTETHSDKALALREEFRGGFHELLAPDVFPAEIGHALARAERKRVISPPDGSLLLADILTTLPQLASSLLLLPEAFSLASALRVSLYDCLYLALADREQCQFLTADTRLVNVLQPHFSFLLPLSYLP